MKKNKFTTYLLYAIGEIVLVVIGILIAVSINNWNIKRSNRVKEVQYLIRLKSEITVNKNLFESSQSRLSSLLNRQIQMLSLLEGQSDISKSDLIWGIEMSGYDPYVDFKTDVWDDLHSSGNELILQDLMLQERISNFYNYEIQEYKRMMETLAEFREENRGLTRGVLNATYRIELIDSYMESTSTEFLALENIDLDEVIREFRSRKGVSSNLADMISPTKLTILFAGENIEEADKIVQAIDLEIHE